MSITTLNIEIILEFEFLINPGFKNKNYLDNFRKKYQNDSTTKFMSDKLLSRNFKNVTDKIVSETCYRAHFLKIDGLVSQNHIVRTINEYDNLSLLGVPGLCLLRESMPEKFLNGYHYITLDNTNALFNERGVYKNLMITKSLKGNFEYRINPKFEFFPKNSIIVVFSKK